METEKRMELANAIIEKVRPVLQDSKSKKLVDYGGGTGLISLELTDLVGSILLVDVSEQALQGTTDKIVERGIPNVKVLCSDFTQDTPDLEADIILLSLVLLHIPDTKLILQKLFSILSDGGQLIIVDFDKNDKVNHPKIHSGFSQDELKKLLSEIGFTSTKMKTFYKGERIFANQDASMFISNSIK